MADTSGMQDLRGIDIDKLAKGFADEEMVLKSYQAVSSTSAREIRWYKKTSGILDTTDTSGITATYMKTDQKALAPVIEQSWTRQTSYVQKYFVESPLLSEEDIKDTDIDILATNVRDLVRAVSKQVDVRIYDVLTESLSPSNINTAAATGTGWDDATNGDPITDILTAKENIRTNNYNPEGAIMYIHPTEERMLLVWLIKTKGSSIPAYSSELIRSPGAVLEILGLRVVVSTNATTDYALIFVPKRACTWKEFTPITSVVINDPGLGRKIRVWCEGEALLTDPKAVHLITDTTT